MSSQRSPAANHVCRNPSCAPLSQLRVSSNHRKEHCWALKQTPVWWRYKSFCVNTTALKYFHCTVLAAYMLLIMLMQSRTCGERMEKTFVIALEADTALGNRHKWCSYLKCFINQLFAREMALLPLSLFPRTAVRAWPAGVGLGWGVGAACCNGGKRAAFEVGPVVHCCLYVLPKCEGREGVDHGEGPGSVGGFPEPARPGGAGSPAGCGSALSQQAFLHPGVR